MLPEVASHLGSPDVTDLILDEHAVFRGQFVALWDQRPGGDTECIATVWQPLADLLEVHAKAEEDIDAYPVLLKNRGSDEAPAETDNTIRDHNEIRDTIRNAASATIGSDRWWEAVLACRPANDEHLAEEEADIIRTSASTVTNAEFVGRPLDCVPRRAPRRWGVSDDDVAPAEYIEDHS